MTDTGNAERLVAHFGDIILYCSESSMWYVYDGSRWVQDHGGRIVRLAIETVRGIITEASLVGSDGSKAADPAELSNQLCKHAAKSEAEGRIMAMVRLARAMRPVCADEFDRDPWLLNTTNGTVDLRTGTLHPASPADKITHRTACGYHSGVGAPQWCAFVRWVFRGDTEMVDYVQELLGMCISGDITEQMLPVFYGDGANGKSTMLDTIMDLAGTYAGKAPPDLLMAKRGESHPTEVADLMGKRLVIASETEEGRKLRTSFVKEATGDREMKARFMRGNFFTFQRTHKLLLATNHKPRVTEGKYSMWRRLRLVPFAATIDDAAQDKRLGEKLMTESVGILAWLVAGCRRWYESGGFDEPAAVREATEEYREEEDPIAEFVEACLDLDADGFAQLKDIRRAYVQWCRDCGVERPLSERAMADRIKNQQGVTKTARRVDGRSVRGLAGVKLAERCALGGGASYE
jgi:putative DNA primase/helicase